MAVLPQGNHGSLLYASGQSTAQTKSGPLAPMCILVCNHS
eukprot:CAMPEP_0177165334 /NCGR_PEP_ID=MMETSP0367-20130122/7439_1 /TAXON_ID=447022 ORGANISM="Scrippsiella hangoei-like, Strain SHHI-4" /NCGR_SAMPLE_ID=MMETSP0367 /ASSEMBLY_ACC=CAM_ASM_000362 /LENGTH=39 /DNA_ID= /DNA_START= /DNA_END= /DNA_ORIENTATION=